MTFVLRYPRRSLSQQTGWIKHFQEARALFTANPGHFDCCLCSEYQPHSWSVWNCTWNWLSFECCWNNGSHVFLYVQGNYDVAFVCIQGFHSMESKIVYKLVVFLVLLLDANSHLSYRSLSGNEVLAESCNISLLGWYLSVFFKHLHPCLEVLAFC